jgi:hypothetical protein
MSSETRRLVRRLIRWVVFSSIVTLGIVVAVRLSRPTVLVGRVWPAAERVAIGGVPHQSWDELLRRYVDADGFVDYTGWKQSSEDMRRLDEYLAALSRADEAREATSAERLAFWINAYNAVTVRGILREYPTTSIQNHVARAWGFNIWRDLKLIVGDRRYSLGDVEHSILRQMNEPRIHFAIVCASRGCPRLLNEAYSADRLEEQLSQNTLAFFADPTKCSVDTAQKELHLSPILDWFAADFGASTPAVLQRIADWLPESAQAVARTKDVRVKYLDYDWSLNDQATAGPPLPPL